MYNKDEAAEALSLQYDRKIEEFFISERESARSSRETSSAALKSEQTCLPTKLREQEGHNILNLTDSEESRVSSDEEFG
jgi:hypothetical protein